MVSLCKNKVKVIYCDFDIKGHKKDQMRLKTKTLPSKENNISKLALPYCHDAGSQPCSCYFSNFSNILQFELSNDEVTRSASSENGTGPQNCDELKNIGHTLDQNQYNKNSLLHVHRNNHPTTNYISSTW